MKISPASLRVIGISEMVVSDEAEDVLVTYSLGSCVGVTLFDPVLRVGGMIHCMIPVSTNDREKAKQKPSMFVDTGIVKLIQTLVDRGCSKENLVCKVAGAGTPLSDFNRFKVGEKNYAVLKKVLEKNGIPIHGECIGGTTAKTMFLKIETGTTLIRVGDEEEKEL